MCGVSVLPRAESEMKETIFTYLDYLDLIQDEMQSDMRTGNGLTNDSSKSHLM